MRIILAIVVFASVLTACQTAPNLDTPPEIIYGEDICEQCNMIISEPRFAAGYVINDGNMRRFDDIGDMMAFNSDRHEDVAVFWVHDYDAKNWIRADDAYYVVSGGLITPMAHGVVAFDDASSAQALADDIGANVMSFADLLEIEVEIGKPLHTHTEIVGHEGQIGTPMADSGGGMEMPTHSMSSN